MSTVAVLNQTREEVAHRQHATATERVRRLESELKITFDDLVAAQESMREAGVNAEVQMSEPLTVAFREWRIAHDRPLEIRPESRKV